MKAISENEKKICQVESHDTKQKLLLNGLKENRDEYKDKLKNYSSVILTTGIKIPVKYIRNILFPKADHSKTLPLLSCIRL